MCSSENFLEWPRGHCATAATVLARPTMLHEPEEEREAVEKEVISNEEWCGWLQEEVRKSASYAENSALLDECCAVAATWRTRFWGRKALWARLRKGQRLVKELAEVVPVLARVRAEVDAMEIREGQPKLVILDLCSGFGYMGMFLSELLSPDKVERIVLVDKMWAPLNIERKTHHLNPEHVVDDGWPIRLSTSRADLKVPSDRRSLSKHFLSHGGPAMLLGVHLCGTLSLRCIELWNDCPGFTFLALKPCCLPEMLFAKRGDIFGAGMHLPQSPRITPYLPADTLCQTRRNRRRRLGPRLPRQGGLRQRQVAA